MEEGRVLSIQSHVVHGYVGNKAACFPLQVLSFDVDTINSVHFSNHTGYPDKWEGDVLNGEQLGCILKGLERNNLLSRTSNILTGYIGSESFLKAVLNVIQTVKKYSPNCRYVCDPVIGDHGKFYVPVTLVDVYRKELIPISNLVTPNQFEAEQLTGVNITTIEDGKEACRKLHEMGPELVVITSMTLAGNENFIVMLASKRVKLQDGSFKDILYSIESPIIEGRYTGTGDVAAALLLGWTCKYPQNLPLVLEKVMSTMYSIIHFTKDHSDGTVAGRELKLIQSKKVIEDPPMLFEAKRLA